jgi:hypothetical protein
MLQEFHIESEEERNAVVATIFDGQYFSTKSTYLGRFPLLWGSRAGVGKLS